MFEVHSVEDLQEISNKTSWQYFEKLVAFIFEENGFDVEQNKVFVKKENKKIEKRQYDVIAKKNDITYLIECKKWKRSNSFKAAIEKHNERCEFYSKLYPEEQVYPLLVNFMERNNMIEEEIPIVPLFGLNRFLNK